MKMVDESDFGFGSIGFTERFFGIGRSMNPFDVEIFWQVLEGSDFRENLDGFIGFSPGHFRKQSLDEDRIV